MITSLSSHFLPLLTVLSLIQKIHLSHCPVFGVHFLDKITEYSTQYFKSFEGKKPEGWLTQTGILRACRELVYDHDENGDPVFHVISYSFNIRRGQLQIEHALDIIIEKDDNDSYKRDICNTLAIAHALELPVLPNTDNLSEELAEYYREVIVHGFVAPDGKGKDIRLRLKKSPGDKIQSIQHLFDLSLTEPHSPSEIALIKTTVEKELSRLSGAQSVLTSLDIAIQSLNEILKSDVRNESTIQNCLTTHPILFGLEYREIIPKHRLGAEYEMDYALKQISGLFDLLEIEASNLPLFNKKGNPSHYLIHAEQQVLDWLLWISKNRPYAQNSLPGIISPIGYVIIGRSSSLKEGNIDKLLQRNAIYRDRLRILTYDDLLNRAITIRQILTAN